MNLKRIRYTIGPLYGIIVVSVLASIFFVISGVNRSLESEIHQADTYVKLVVKSVQSQWIEDQESLFSVSSFQEFKKIIYDYNTEGKFNDMDLKYLEKRIKAMFEDDLDVDNIYIKDSENNVLFSIAVNGGKKIPEYVSFSSKWYENDFGHYRTQLGSTDKTKKFIIEIPLLEEGQFSGYTLSLQKNMSNIIHENLILDEYQIEYMSHDGHLQSTSNHNIILGELYQKYGIEMFEEPTHLTRLKETLYIDDVHYYKKHVVVSYAINEYLSIVVLKPYNKFSIEYIGDYLLSHFIVISFMIFAVVSTIIYSSQKTKKWVDSDRQFLNEIIDMDKIQISELKKELRFHLDFFSEASLPFLIVDKESLRILNANTEATKYYAYTEEALLDLYLSDICKWDNVSETTEHIITVTHVKSDGQEELKSVRVQEVFFNDSELLIIMVLGGNVTSSSDLKDMRIEMFHEIRSPLQGAMGAVEKIDMASESFSEYTSIIKRSLTNVLTMTNNVLADGKLASQFDKIFLSEFDLKEMVNEVISVTVYQDKNYNMIASNIYENINDTLEPIEHYMVQSDPIKLRQILINLMSNASKYTHDGLINLSIEIAKQPTQDIIIFRVSDSGIGLSKEEIDHLYEAFQTFATNDKITSTGIGLNITKKYVEMLGSDLHVSSEHGVGTTFSFSLVVKRKEQKITKRTYNKSILIVDDDTVNCDFLRHVIETDLNSYVKTLSNETELLTELNRHEYDCMIIDQNLNHFKGTDFIALIRNSMNKRIAEIPIVLITASNVVDDLSDTRLAVDKILLKPFDHNDIIETITEILSKDIKEWEVCAYIDETIIDKKRLCETLDAVGKEVFIELVGKFIINSTEELHLVNILIEDGDFERIQAILHRLKGSMSYFAPVQCNLKIQALEQLALTASENFLNSLKIYETAHELLLIELKVICKNL